MTKPLSEFQQFIITCSLSVAVAWSIAACAPDAPQDAPQPMPPTLEQQAREQAHRTLAEGKPVLVREHDGVRLWKILDRTTSSNGTIVYFSTLGDVSYERVHTMWCVKFPCSTTTIERTVPPVAAPELVRGAQ